MLPFTLQIQDGLPVSDQIEMAVRRAILTGQMQDGDVFPSVRVLSQELRISPTTAHKVVSQLKDDGYLASRPGIGMVVTARSLPSSRDRIGQLLPACKVLLDEAAGFNLTLEETLQAVRQAAAARKPKP